MKRIKELYILSQPQPLKATIGAIFGNLLFSLKSDRNFNLLLATGFFAGISSGITSTTFNNFLNDVYHLSEASRGIVEFPRELPGALLIFVFAAFSFMSDVRLASLGMVFASLGMFGLGLLSPGFAPMLIWMVVLNLGTHIGMPLAPSIGMSLSKTEEYGMRLGRYNAYCLAATIIGYIIVLVGFNYLKISYTAAFIIAGFGYLLAAVTYLFMHKPMVKAKKKPRFVFRKKYTIFYMQSITNGARKQIFLTFAPWVLIKIYHLDTPMFAILGFVVAFASIGTRTIVGRAIDRLGERVVLSTEAILLIILCMGYAFSADIFPVYIAVIISAGCYVIDNSLSAVEMARSTYVRKLADDPDEVLPTLSTGTSFDHVVAMTIPALGGILWAATSYKMVFIAASFIAVANLFLSFKMDVARKDGD